MTALPRINRIGVKKNRLQVLLQAVSLLNDTNDSVQFLHGSGLDLSHKFFKVIFSIYALN